MLVIVKTSTMQRNSIYTTANKLNPLFQQQQPQGRVQVRDIAFYMKKYAFMQQPVKASLPEKKK